MHTVDQVIEFIRQNNDLGDMDIRAESKLIADLGLTSFDILDMYYHMETMFHIEVNEDDMNAIETVGDIAKYISERSKNGVNKLHEPKD